MKRTEINTNAKRSKFVNEMSTTLLLHKLTILIYKLNNMAVYITRCWYESRTIIK
jgi:hypothetical protein